MPYILRGMKKKGLWTLGLGCVAVFFNGYERNEQTGWKSFTSNSVPILSKLTEGTTANFLPKQFLLAQAIRRMRMVRLFTTDAHPLPPLEEVDEEIDSTRKYNLEVKADLVDFYRIHKTKFKHDPGSDSYWTYLTSEDLKDEDGTMASDALPARKWLLRTEANLLPFEIVKLDVSFLQSQAVQIPQEFVAVAEELLVFRAKYLNDPSYLRNYANNVSIRTKRDTQYNKLAAAYIVVVHARTSTSEDYDRLAVIIRDKTAYAIRFFPSGDVTYKPFMNRVKSRHYYNAAPYEEAYMSNELKCGFQY